MNEQRYYASLVNKVGIKIKRCYCAKNVFGYPRKNWILHLPEKRFLYTRGFR